MGLFEHFPYTNFHDLNLSWILEALKEIQTTTEQFVALNSLKYADPIQWNIVQQYEKNTIVIDPLTGTAYISVQPVPSGVALTNTDYWTVVFDLGSFVTRAAKNFTDRWEEDTTLTATFPTAAGEWLVWGDTLYEALVNITAGDTYVVDSNIKHFTIEELKDAIYGAIDTLDTDLNDKIDQLEINLNDKIGDLSSLKTIIKSSLAAAINEVFDRFLSITVNVEDDFIATQNWTTGTWLWIAGNLYEVMAPITTGDTLVVNTNIKAVTVEYLLNSLRSALDTRINNIRGSITVNHENTNIATTAWTAGTWLYIGDALYEVIANCTIGDTLDNTKVTPRTVEYMLRSLSNRVGKLTDLNTTDKSSIVNAINEVNDLVSSFNGITLIIGDSYGQGAGTGGNSYTPFPTIMKQKLGWTEGVECYTNCYGGSGFVAALVGKSFLTLLQELDSTVPADDHKKVSRILVAGGYNDVGLTGIEAAIANFMQYAKMYFPNAKVYCAHIGWTTNISNRVSLSNNIAIWKHEVPLNGGIYIANSEYILHNYGTYYDPDGVHPNNTGQLFIAMYLNEGMFTGICDVDSNLTGFSITPSSYVTSCDFSGFLRLKNGSVYFNPNSPLNAELNHGVTVVSGAGYTFGKINSDWIKSLGNPNFNAFPCGGYAKFTYSGSDFYVTVAGSLNLDSSNNVSFKLDYVAPSGNVLQNLVDDVEFHLNVNSTVFDSLMI